MKKLIREIFSKTINEKFNNANHESICKFLLNHPLKETMFDNLEKEIKDAGYVLSDLSGDLQKKRNTIENMIRSITLMFCKTALDVKENELREITTRRCCGD